MKTPEFTTGLCMFLLFCSGATAQHAHTGDFALEVEFNSVIVEPRVLPAELHRDEFFSTDEPGFNSEPQTFPPGTAVSFNILDPLKRWNADALEPWLPVVEETITVSFLQRLVQTGPGFVPSFDLALAEDGSWHRHLMFTLTNSSAGAPGAGIYLLAMELYSTSPGVKSSYPVYIVFDVESEHDHEHATEWVHENLAGPVCVQKIAADLNGDCQVNFQDLALFADSWLSCNLRPRSARGH